MDQQKKFFHTDMIAELCSSKEVFGEKVGAQLSGYHSHLKIVSHLSGDNLLEVHNNWSQRAADHDWTGLGIIDGAADLAVELIRRQPIIDMEWPSGSRGFRSITRAREYHLLYANEYAAFCLGLDIGSYLLGMETGDLFDPERYPNKYRPNEELASVICRDLRNGCLEHDWVRTKYIELRKSPPTGLNRARDLMPDESNL